MEFFPPSIAQQIHLAKHININVHKFLSQTIILCHPVTVQHELLLFPIKQYVCANGNVKMFVFDSSIKFHIFLSTAIDNLCVLTMRKVKKIVHFEHK